MSKKYFTAYLPVEGEIKEGDKYSSEGYNEPKTASADWSKSTCSFYDVYKVKLFLCSRDIQVGDKVIYEATPLLGEKVVKSIDDKLVTTNDGDKTYSHNLIRVIGEISSDALSYVKEGQEFDENKVCIYAFDGQDDNYFSIEEWDEEKYHVEYWHIEVKGPCGHFH